MSTVGQWKWREGEGGRSGEVLLIADIQSSRQMEYLSSETSLVNVLEEKESSGDSCISTSSMTWCRSEIYHLALTHWLKPVTQPHRTTTYQRSAVLPCVQKVERLGALGKQL